MKRTHLPLNALRVFDAAARHLSFTRAADELAVTPAAVGQQIRALEDVLGVVLFRRTSKGLELTDEAVSGLDPLREGFLRFEESVQAMQAGQASSSYTIAVPREFYAQWLAPRLASFRLDHPDVRFNLVADEDADFTEANLDVAVRLVEGPGELEGVQLAPGHRVVVAAPDAADGWIAWPGFPLPDGAEEKALLQVGNAGQALSSALAGLGRAIMPLPLVAGALEDGSLSALEGPADCRRAYWLLAPRPQWRQKKVKALVDHLAQ
ncbi:LysR family glycine cleavage system transcriptional activator [Altererythrobacter atlanticus]|uniref:Glycine cleavage system transcriptional activator n=1 Tax=Croceibacterium atlanticum TaxID=1267766 RepID=A0A0F7KPV0_9SPHN|nr:LysR family transcriptional regulator [Croceibacterium atlanticum]AKH41137.1 Glycine cleavage system transcriptional activator [Croceibacterium atlanticum]MBB5732653.1 LysR family glycine cleavage system transcriptional activator [Croceibacterium atlanticum]